MPASALTVRIGVQRGCPACTQTRCADPAECLYFLTNHPWTECSSCDGSGWASEDSPALTLYCQDCGGSRLMEANRRARALGEISENAEALRLAYVARLRARIAGAPVAVAA